jgi:hypothetical protein
MRINKGRGSKVKVATELKMLGPSCSKPGSPPQNMNAPPKQMSMKQKPTGIPVANKASRLPRRIRAIHHQSKEF